MVQRFGWTFAPGDKVMQIENDYDKEVYKPPSRARHCITRAGWPKESHRHSGAQRFRPAAMVEAGGMAERGCCEASTGMTPEDLAALRRAVRSLEHPDLAAPLANMLGNPIERIGDLLPIPARHAIPTATSKGLEVALNYLDNAKLIHLLKAVGSSPLLKATQTAHRTRTAFLCQEILWQICEELELHRAYRWFSPITLANLCCDAGCDEGAIHW